MTQITKRTLPHTLASASYTHSEVRQVVMLLMENIKVLQDNIAQLQTAVQELQRR